MRTFKIAFAALGWLGFIAAIGFAGDPAPECMISVWGQIAGMFGGVVAMAVGYYGTTRYTKKSRHCKSGGRNKHYYINKLIIPNAEGRVKPRKG